jgi:hypothetical protein
MANDPKKTAIYITLVFLGVLISTLYVMMLTYNVTAFIILFTLYILGYSCYMFIIMMMNKSKWQDDMRFEVGNYITLFNIFFASAILLLTMFFRKPSSSSGITYSSSY